MTFEDVENAAAEFIATAPTSETFEYRSVIGGMAGSWEPISGHVLPGNPEDDQRLGRGRRTSEPIRVVFPQSQKDAIHEGADQVRWNGAVYTVRANLHEATGAWWILYCER